MLTLLFHVINHVIDNDDDMSIGLLLDRFPLLNLQLLQTTFVVQAVKNNRINISKLIVRRCGIRSFVHAFNTGMLYINRIRTQSSLICSPWKCQQEKTLLQQHLLFERKFNGIDMFLLEPMVEANYSFNSTLQNGMTPLGSAIKNANDTAIELLLRSHNIKIDESDEYGRTPSWYLMMAQHYSPVGDLLSQKEQFLSSKSLKYIWCYKVQKAIFFDNDKEFEELCKTMDNERLLDKAWPLKLRPLPIAARLGKSKIVQFLLSKKRNYLSNKQLQIALEHSSDSALHISTCILLAGSSLVSNEKYCGVYKQTRQEPNWCRLLFIAGQNVDDCPFYSPLAAFGIYTASTDLQNLCRLKIRKTISTHTTYNLVRDICLLPVPYPVQTYLLYGEDIRGFMKQYQAEKVLYSRSVV